MKTINRGGKMTLAERISQKLSDEKSYTAFSVRVSKKHYDILQELEGLTGKKPAVLARACLEAALEDLYESVLMNDGE